ncbi:hypothetical protein RJG79_12065 [Mycoplasmatota bacterium WC44]
MKKPSLTFALRLVAVSIIIVSAVYIWISVEKNLWDELWYLYGTPIIVWWILDIVFNYTNGPIFYRGLLPFFALLYIILSIVLNEWIETIIIVAFIPFSVLVYNAKFYPLKYSIIPVIASFLLIVYLSIGIYFNTWHPTWLMFLIVPIIPLLQTYD